MNKQKLYKQMRIFEFFEACKVNTGIEIIYLFNRRAPAWWVICLTQTLTEQIIVFLTASTSRPGDFFQWVLWSREIIKNKNWLDKQHDSRIVLEVSIHALLTGSVSRCCVRVRALTWTNWIDLIQLVQFSKYLIGL